MKQLLMVLVLVLSMVVVMPVVAQDGTSAIAYGEVVTGEITNQTFEKLYTFEGVEGDVVVIELKAAEYSFDAYLYLTTADNETIAYNDDADGLDSRIVMLLPSDGTYTIIASRNGGRTGSGEGGFTLTLNKLDLLGLDSPVEGTYTKEDAAPVHVLSVPTTGVYTIIYAHTGGNLHPNLEVTKVTGSYNENISRVEGVKLLGAQVMVELEADALYTISLTQNYYEYFTSEGDNATYKLTVVGPRE